MTNITTPFPTLPPPILPERLENPSGNLIESVRGRATVVYAATPSSDHRGKIRVILTDPWLTDFFIRHQTRWIDLCYKIRKLYTANPHKILTEKEKNSLFQEVFPILVSPERKQSVRSPQKRPDWSELESIVMSDIIENGQLLWYAIGVTPRSFVESPSSALTNIRSPKGLEHYIMNLLQRQNTNNQKPLTQFNEAFWPIIDGIKSIYSIDITQAIPGFKSVGTFTDLGGPAEYLYRSLTSGDPRTREMTTLFMHALYAWWNIREIQRHREFAKRAQKNIWRLIEKTGFVGGLKISLAGKPWGLEDWYSWECIVEVNWKKHHIRVESRVKSLRSTLIKLMGDESYGNIESIKDMLGFRIFLKEVPRDDWSDIIKAFEWMYGAGAYILKNKNLVSTEELEVITRNADNIAPPPVTAKKQRTADWFENLAYSGYISTNIDTSEVGFEVQFFEDEESANPQREWHHTILDAKKIVQGWVRNMHFITLPQIIAIFRREMQFDRETNKSPSWLTLAWGVMSFLNSMGTLFVEEGSRSAFFSVRGYEYLTRESFPKLREYKIVWNVEKIVRTFLTTTLQVRAILDIPSSPSTPETSSQPPVQDWWSWSESNGGDAIPVK